MTHLTLKNIEEAKEKEFQKEQANQKSIENQQKDNDVDEKIEQTNNQDISHIKKQKE